MWRGELLSSFQEEWPLLGEEEGLPGIEYQLSGVRLDL